MQCDCYGRVSWPFWPLASVSQSEAVSSITGAKNMDSPGHNSAQSVAVASAASASALLSVVLSSIRLATES